MNIALPHRGKLTITGNVLENFYSFVQVNKKDLEACGMLVGHHPRRTDDIVLDRLTLPQPSDKRTRTCCHRSQADHQRLLDAEWRLSHETRTYVGEWHTHPEAMPRPSRLDRKSWVKAVKETKFHGPGLVFIVVGTQMTGVWFRGRKHRSHIKLSQFPNQTLS